ncbi:MAG: extracellular solute-binding protein [Anaerolineae bacterium]|nr:extracellular solute-binding protein [Anaerolineae bacterium]
MSTKLSRRQFLKVAGITTLSGVLAACAKPTAEPTQAPVEEATKAPEPVAAPAETVVLDYYIVGAGDTDQRALVEAAINEYIEPLIGANVVFHVIGWGDWASKSVTGIQAGEKMDIFFTADWYYYMQLTTEGLFTPLNDDDGPNGNLLEQYGQGILSSLNPAFITGTQIDGVNYAVPTNKELTVPEGFLYNVALAEEIGFTEADAAKIKSYRDMEPWLEKAKAARPDEYPYLAGDGRDGFSPWTQDLASGVSGRLINMKLAPDANGVWDETILSIMEQDVTKERLLIMREWYEKGWIHPDSGLSTFDSSQYLNAGQFFIEPMPLKGNNIKAQEMMNASGNEDLRLAEIYGQPKVNITTHAGGSMLAIPAMSEYPVQAMQYINLLHSDPKVINMQLFGVEGTHWEKEADGRVNLIDSAWYGAHAGAWTVGNTMLQLVTNKEDPDKNRMLIEYSNDAIDHVALGFRFRTDPIAAELTAVNAVYDGMDRALQTGYVDPEVELPKYIADLKAAGFDTIKAEVEKQYAEWKAKKG